MGSNMFKNLVNIIASPREAFQSIQEKPTILGPLVLILGALALAQFWVLTHVDYDYFVEAQIERAVAQQNGQEEQIRSSYEQLSPTLMGAISAGSTTIFLLLVFTLYAAFLNLMAKFSDDRYNFKHWFSIICWTGIPVLFTSLAMVVNLMLSADGQLDPSQLNPLSLNNLIFQTSGSWQTFLSALDVTQIWSMVLIVLGYQYSTNQSGLKSSIIALSPILLIFGIWAGVTLI